MNLSTLACKVTEGARGVSVATCSRLVFSAAASACRRDIPLHMRSCRPGDRGWDRRHQNMIRFGAVKLFVFKERVHR